MPMGTDCAIEETGLNESRSTDETCGSLTSNNGCRMALNRCPRLYTVVPWIVYRGPWIVYRGPWIGYRGTGLGQLI
jgi:hypothetical protein